MPECTLPAAFHAFTYYPTDAARYWMVKEYIRHGRGQVFECLGVGNPNALWGYLRWPSTPPSSGVNIVWYGSEAPLYLYEIPWQVSHEP